MTTVPESFSSQYLPALADMDRDLQRIVDDAQAEAERSSFWAEPLREESLSLFQFQFLSEDVESRVMRAVENVRSVMKADHERKLREMELQIRREVLRKLELRRVLGHEREPRRVRRHQNGPGPEDADMQHQLSDDSDSDDSDSDSFSDFSLPKRNDTIIDLTQDEPEVQITSVRERPRNLGEIRGVGAYKGDWEGDQSEKHDVHEGKNERARVMNHSEKCTKGDVGKHSGQGGRMEGIEEGEQSRPRRRSPFFAPQSPGDKYFREETSEYDGQSQYRRRTRSRSPSFAPRSPSDRHTREETPVGYKHLNKYRRRSRSRSPVAQLARVARSSNVDGRHVLPRFESSRDKSFSGKSIGRMASRDENPVRSRRRSRSPGYDYEHYRRE